MWIKSMMFSCAAITFVACGGADGYEVSSDGIKSAYDLHQEPLSEGNWYKPTKATTWQWQLSKDINTSYNVAVYDVDLVETPQNVIDKLHSEGKKVICYFSGGSYESYRDDASDFNESILGNILVGWDNEKWLDIRSASLKPIMRARLDLAVEKRCDGVEPDNMDAFQNNSGFPLSSDDQLAYNKFIANEAHDRNLSVALKNDVDQIKELEPYYDFAVNEQCYFYKECEQLRPFLDMNKAVFNAEYDEKYVKNSDGARDVLCTQARADRISTLVLPLDLDDSFRYSCDEL